MIRLILLTDFTESFSYNLLKGVLAYSKKHEPWVVCRMPPSYKLTYGIEGVLKWAEAWQADAIIGRFDNDDNVELVCVKTELSQLRKTTNQDSAIFPTSPATTTKPAGWQQSFF